MNLAQISSNIIFITTITIITGKKLNSNTLNNIRLPHYVIPVHYQIKLTHLYMETYDFYWPLLPKELNLKNENDSFHFHGESSITINILQSTQYIALKLHALNLIISSRNTLIKNNGIIYGLKTYIEIPETNLLEVRFLNVLSSGLYTFKMEFSGLLTENFEKSFFKSFYTNKKDGIAWLIASHIQANGARRLFPCWDEPHLKATFTISLKHHHDFTVLSNMPPRIHLSSDINNFIWTHFYTTPPMSTLQIAIVITTYPRMRINENIYLWCEKCSEYNNQSLKFEFARRIIENITLHLQSEFSGINIPKMDHVAIPNFLHDGMSKWGLIFHREVDLIYEEQLDPVMRKIEIARLIAPKIAYQWFSNVLSSWSHFWLHDGLATLFAEEAIVKTFNNSELLDFFIVQNQYESLHLNSHFDMNPAQINSLSEIDSIFHFPRYMKVLIFLRMYQNEITDEVFRKNVHTYLYQHTFSSMIPYKIWSTIQENLSNTNPYYMPNEFLNWTKYRHYPIVKWTQENPSYGKFAQYFNAMSYGKWWLHINIIEQSFFLGNFYRKIRLISQIPIHLYHKNEQDWILIDIQQAGYYRINYNSENWHKIIYYLNSNSGEYKNINVINRAKIIDDAFHLAMAHQLNISTFWELTKYLSQETSYVAWYPMIKVFEYMSTIFPFPPLTYEPGYIDIKEKFRILLDEALSISWLKENMDNDLTNCLRQEIVKWACTLDHPVCTRVAYYDLYDYLHNFEKYPVLPEWEQWTYCKGLSLANDSVWYELNVILSRKPDHKMLPFLACSIMNHYNVSRHLPYLFQQFTSDEKQDIAVIRSQIITFYSVIMKYINTYYIFDELVLNLLKIKPEEIKTLTALTVIINNIYNVKFLEYMIFKILERLRYINMEQLSMIQHKLTKRNLEIEKHVKYFQIMNIQA